MEVKRKMKKFFKNKIVRIVALALIVLDLLISLILPINSTSRFLQIINICVLGIILLPVYLKLNKKYLSDILPDKILKILTKLHI